MATKPAPAAVIMLLNNKILKQLKKLKPNWLRSVCVCVCVCACTATLAATAALAAPLRARLLFYFASGPHTATAALAALRALLLAATKPLRARAFLFIFF